MQFINMFVIGFYTYEVFFFVADNHKRKTHFKENYTFRLDTMSNDNGGVAQGNRKSQPAKVWSINTKYHVVLTNNTCIQRLL